MKIALLSCVKSKQEGVYEAQNLYTSSLFKYMKAYAQKYCDKFYILSAKHGLLKPTDTICNYNDTLNTKSDSERLRWTKNVLFDLLPLIDRDEDEFVILAGLNYRKYLIKFFEANNLKYSVPMKGLGLGRQLKFLKDQT